MIHSHNICKTVNSSLLRSILKQPASIRAFVMATPNGTNAAATAPQAPATSRYKPRYIDIGINLTDPVYTGHYHSTQRHPSDLHAVVSRAVSAGCKKLLITGSDLKESRRAIELAQEFPNICYTTVGIHPCNTLQFTLNDTPHVLLSHIRSLALSSSQSGHCVAFGEIGLDYDRLSHAPKDIQLTYFEAQLDLATELNLPLFLHSRAAHADFIRVLGEREDRLPRRGVVHSFTGTKEEVLELVERGWSIGINGCSLKTEENCEVVRAIPLDKLMLETDGPWCEMRASHAGTKFLERLVKEGKVTEEEFEGGERRKWVKKEKFVEGALVKGRNESCLIGKVAWAVAGIKGMGIEVVAEAAWRNTVEMFGLGDETRGKGETSIS